MDHQQRDQQGAGTGRLLLFGVVCFAILFGWNIFQNAFWPPKPKPDKEIVADDREVEPEESEGPGDGSDSGENPAKPEEGGEAKPQPPKAKLAQHPARTIVLGSDDPESGFAMSVEVETLGAGIRSARLNDKRYVVVDLPEGHPEGKPRPQLSVLGNNALSMPRFSIEEPEPKRRPALSFDLTASRITEDDEGARRVVSLDRQWRKIDPNASMKTLNWRVVKTQRSKVTDIISSVTLELESPDGQLAFRKTFTLNRSGDRGDKEEDSKQGKPKVAADMLGVTVTIVNRGRKNAELFYQLQGPVGIPLENAEYGRRHRSIQVGFIDESDVEAESLLPAALVKQVESEDVELWTKPVKYVGVDIQYFAALMFPGGNQKKDNYFETISPVLIGTEPRKTDQHDVSVELTSKDLTLRPDKSISHTFQVYLGPKRTERLAEVNAEGVIDSSWLSFELLRNVMVWGLKELHGIGLPFGIAIILLTVCVRLTMFPISRKMARSQKRMKDLQPQIADLKEKYKDEPQKMSQAQMELWRKEGVNPLGGCLPALCQLPIFVALYSSLNTWVDLRMASFLWIDNLAAPDHLGDLPFSIWPLGSWFNLLPLITVALFYIQQKMTMPEAINDEMRMQQKMMTIMMMVMGFLFYSFPAGLNVYFIASSVWGMCERKILDKLPEKPVDPEKEEARRKKKEKGWFASMMKQVMEAAELQKQLDSQRDGTADQKGLSTRPGGPPNRGDNKGHRRKKRRR